MSHFITVPVNENGIVFDPLIDVAIQSALQAPFGFRDVYVYSHGWSTNADAALAEYGRFSIAFAKMLLEADPAVLKNPPKDTFGVGIHWPSEITEDPTSPLNVLQLFTFYTMEHRADGVGKNAVYTMLRLMLQTQPAVSLRFFLIGHSFGCRVMCAALQDLQTDIASQTIPVAPNTQFNVALLEPAMDQDNLDPGDIYGNVSAIQNLRLLLSTSQLDYALGKWFPLAGATANLIHKGDPPVALGYVGPTATTAAAFGGNREVSIELGTTVSDLGALSGQRLITADLTALHQARIDSGDYSGGGLQGSHSDIDNDEVRALLAAFYFS